VYERCLFLRDHGRQPGAKTFFNTEIGYKYRMSSMQAALGLAQLERIDELIERKRQIFRWYETRLSGLGGVTLNYEAPETLNTYWMVSVILDPKFGIEKDDLMRYMSDNNIDCRPFFRPLSSLPAYEGLPQVQTARRENIVSYELSPYGLNLPCGMNMTEEKVAYVCSVIESILAEGGVPA
jgi:perosamine synthetase